MKRLGLLAATGLIGMLPSIASARPHFFFGFGLPFPIPVPVAFGAYSAPCVTTYVAPPVVYTAPAPVVYSAPAPVVYAPPAPVCGYSYTFYAPPVYYHRYAYIAPVRVYARGYGYYYYRH